MTFVGAPLLPRLILEAVPAVLMDRGPYNALYSASRFNPATNPAGWPRLLSPLDGGLGAVIQLQLSLWLMSPLAPVLLGRGDGGEGFS